jgi:Uma2 family endonuclease
MGMPSPTYYTAEMVRALPDDGNRYEVVHGELLVTPAPRLWHQELVMRLSAVLWEYLRRVPMGKLLASPADISWGEDDLLQPDLFVIPLEEARTLEWRKVRTLLLAIEVLSPSTARFDRFTKRRRYQEAGVPVYWIVDGEQRVVELWTPEAKLPEIEQHRIRWQPAGAAEAIEIDLEELFRPI